MLKWGIKCGDLFDLEMEFYEAIEFDLYVDEHEFEEFKKEVFEFILVWGEPRPARYLKGVVFAKSWD